MTVLRSRKVVSVIHKVDSTKSGVEIEPVTPAKEVETTNKSSYETTPSSDKVVQGLRRSARLSLKSSSYNVVENAGSRRKRKVVNLEYGEGPSVNDGSGLFVTGGMEEGSCGSERVESNVRVSRELYNASDCEANGNLVSDMGTDQHDKEEIQSVRNVRRRGFPSLDVEVSGSESAQDSDVGNGCLKLRPGKKLLKQGIKYVDGDRKVTAHNEEKETEEKEVEGGVTIEAKGGSRGTINGSKKAWRRFSREDKKKGVAVDGEEMEIDIRNDVNDTIKRDTSRFQIDEKGKGKVIEADSPSNSIDTDDLHSKPEDGTIMDSAIADTASGEQATIDRAGTSTKLDPKERFKNVARKNASKFAYFSVQEEEEDPNVDEVELELPQTEANEDVEDWPGPFSTALKIIKDRAANIPTQQKNVTSEKSHSVPLIWVPKEKQQRERLVQVPPSLQELCMAIMAENVDAITSLESVPDVLRHKLTHLLCDTRKMNYHFFDLLASGSPSEIRIQDCSWLDEEQLIKTLERTDTSKLMVLQLDQCGRCLPDYVLFTTLAHMPSKLSALTNISLKGACRLSDAGLNALVASAPALRSINLGCCSLLTSDGIINLADKLGPILKELYIDECFGIDAKRILPALLKLEQLEVLSISRFETVNDSFVRQFVAIRGPNMKELVLADCTKLTDKALKTIAESCPGLCAIDLTNLCKLTDNALGHLANGCQTIQTMKFCRNAFSDEAVAAYLEACGGPLKELSLNHLDKVGHHTALSLAKHGRKLVSLDLSWCRDMTNEAVGLIVDSCLSLKMLKLFGCTQITNVFTEGHSNEEVKILGLKGSQILNNIEVPHLLPLRYSSL